MGSRREGGAEGHLAAATKLVGSSEIGKALLVNVVNENETNWTHFHSIMHPAQVKRSEVQRNTCAKPPNLLSDRF